MSRHTMRLCWPDNSHPDDYVFRIDGKDVGRCYLMIAADSRLVWRWTVHNVPYGGMEDTLEEAQRRFKQTYEAALPSNSA